MLPRTCRYEILQFFRKNDGSYNYKLVGNWDNNTLKLNGRELNVGLKSTCSDDCEIGERKVIMNERN